MSIINRKPLIITVLESLETEQISTLKTLINGSGAAPVFRSLIAGSPHILTSSDAGIKRVNLELGKGIANSVVKGYLIYTDDYKVLISYANETAQILSLIVLEKKEGNWAYEFRNCELSINELRSELDDALESGGEGGSSEVSVSDIVSTGQTAGKVIMADGSGGAEWGEVSGGMEVLELTISGTQGVIRGDDHGITLWNKLKSDNVILKIGSNYYHKHTQQEENGEVIGIMYENDMYMDMSSMSMPKMLVGMVIQFAYGSTIEEPGVTYMLVTSQAPIDDGEVYLTTAPTANNTNGRLKFVVLSSEPATKYDGYLYIITGSN